MNRLTQEDFNVIAHALEVFKVYQEWDGANKITIQKVLSKINRLRNGEYPE